MISVAIAAYNGERFIIKQLESILNQSLPVDEVVICDDCSTDNTLELCRRFIEEKGLDNWHIFKNESNVGYCLNFYGAIEKCVGDVIFLADQDDEWLQGKTEKMMKCLKENPDISVLSSRYNVIDENSKIMENSGVTYLGGNYDDSVEYVSAESQVGCSYIRGFSLCFRKEIKPLIKPIDLKSLLSHDWLICMVGSIAGKTAILNTVLTNYRFHSQNVSLLTADKKREERRLDKRILGLEESVNGHSYLLSLTEDNALKASLKKFIVFEKKRIEFLKTKNIFKYMALLGHLKEYNRYYKGNGIRVWLGDLFYAYKK
ncbi:MAG: glycosyltransferase [Clostridia bacterium]|nr:glycosyltransferase [Clostridia bacterium]